jgi:putative methionine-R-sulfoxide reductase with GAF domain
MLSGSVVITIPKIPLAANRLFYNAMNNSEETNEATAGDVVDWQALLTGIIADFDCVTGTLHRFDPTDQHLKLVAQQGIPEVLMPVVQSIPIGKGIAGAAAQTRQPVEMCNLQTDTSGVAKPGAKQTQVQGTLAVPVLDGDRLCGTLGIGKMVPYDFSEEEKNRLLAVAAEMAQRLAASGR